MSICNAEESTLPVHLNNRKAYTLVSHQFNRDQFYEGEFYRNSLHGHGTYTWRNLAVYEGGFYSNSKEGYASLSFADNSHFEGLFIKNQPFGPGILTYPNGRQDAGLWRGRKLIRLSRAVDYIIPRLAPTPAGKIKLLQFKYLLPLNEVLCNSATKIMEKFDCQPINSPTPYSNYINDRRSMFFNNEIFDNTYFMNQYTSDFLKERKDLENGIRFSVELNGEVEDTFSIENVPSHCLCQQDVFEMDYETFGEKDSCENVSFNGELELGILGYFTKFGTTERTEVEENQVLQENEEETDESKRPKILLWNRSKLCKEIIKEMFRYRGFEENLNFNLTKLMLGVRNAFRRTGEKEKQCLQLLKMCSLGPPHAVKDLLCSYEISEDLTDCRGNNSLMFAAAADQHEIIDILLNYGVDVDNFNDEGLTPLNLCLLRRLALTNKISSWETAFLPQEIDQIVDDFQDSEFQALQSIESLDRIFGDGMSIHDSKTLIQDDRFLAFLPTVFEDSYCSLKPKTMSLIHKCEVFNFSQITILDLWKSPENYSLVTFDEEESKQSYCSFKTIDPLQKIESDEPTIKIKLIPKPIKRIEFEKSTQKASTDRYLFGFTFKKNPLLEKKKEKEGTSKSSKAKSSRANEKKEEKKEEENEETEEEKLELTERLEEIDKTIEKLLRRGADPNISEVPKPSIHLGVYTKDLKTICSLLTYGASPNCQLYPNEGLLTPLHVIVLQEPDPINVEICDLLLNFEADPELETSPEFSMCEEEKYLLVSEYGRTPLQLLCMRPDLEYADPQDHLIQIGLLLAKVSNKRHFYNGHSYLTLAMLTGNIKLLRALLYCKLVDPNIVLDNDRGTALHVLVSTEFQKTSNYENSIKMCDLLISRGADPLKKFDYPEKLVGTCVDYGYREIEEEKKARKASASSKKESRKKEKSVDFLKDQERVVEYLSQIAKNLAKEKEIAAAAKKNRKAHYQDMEGASENEEKDVRKMEKNKEKEDTISANQEKEYNKKKPGSESTRGYSETIAIPDSDKNGAEIKKEKGFLVDTSVNDKKVKDKVMEEEPIKCKTSVSHTKRKRRKKIGHVVKKSKECEAGKREKVQTTTPQDNEKSKNAQKGTCSRRQRTTMERFPEKLRLVFLQVYGTRLEVDINELLMPYVVLRNGELYYRFHKKPTNQKEQYSLI